jgi:ribosomal protein S18 acetylase RimI-like enzyme
LTEDWKKRAGLLVALLAKEPVGYISLAKDVSPTAAWVTDLVVMRRARRQGIGSGLVLAAQEWARQNNLDHLVLEMQPKNYAAICLAQKLGFEFCGYNDRYYDNRDIVLLFSRSVR